MIDRYYPKGTKFTSEFLGGMPGETGLQTAKGRSGITNEFDGYFE